MFRVQSLAICCLTFGMFMTMETSQADAGGFYFSGGRYSSSYFHDYHNYGARYSHRSYGTYYGNYGARSHHRYGYAGHYGGWSTYAPYAYTPSTQYVSYGSRYARGCNTCAPVVVQPVVVNQCGPTCCSAGTAYGHGCFSGGCGVRRRCGLLGPLCPFRRASYAYGGYSSYGYASYGW